MAPTGGDYLVFGEVGTEAALSISLVPFRERRPSLSWRTEGRFELWESQGLSSGRLPTFLQSLRGLSLRGE